jgi:cytoskeletal protein CcmA (bactofilin family)
MMIVEAETHLEGHLVVSGAIELNGRLVGNLYCARLQVGPGGDVRGDITAEEVVVEGQIIGNVRARVVVVRSSGLVEGDIFHQRLTVAAGAVHIGDRIRLQDGWTRPTMTPSLSLALERIIDLS